MKNMTLEELVEKYASDIAAIDGDFTINDIKRAYSTGFQIGELMTMLRPFENNRAVKEEEK
jgi:hypothetical protein